MSEVRENCRRILARINEAAARCGRDPKSIQLLAVTKTVPPDRIREAVECGIQHLGENRLQEALPKVDALHDLPVTWHFIGHLQTNKAKKVAEHFGVVQSVDRLELAEKLNAYAERPLHAFIEVKLHEEPNKSGVAEADVEPLAQAITRFDKLRLRGLMAIPPFFENAEESRPYFRRLRELGKRLRLTDLSMGMSNDFEVAIEEGATMVRIGSALFGARPK